MLLARMCQLDVVRFDHISEPDAASLTLPVMDINQGQELVAKIADFGLATAVYSSSSQFCDEPTGTQRWMAPEMTRAPHKVSA